MNYGSLKFISGRAFVWLGAAMLLILATPAARAQVQQSAPAAGAPPAKAEDIAKGKKDFVAYACYSCHGHSGQGSDSGPRIDTNRLSLQAFSRYVRQPAGSMPPYRTQGQLSDAALAEIYAYLKSIPPPTDPKSIPLLNDE